MSNPKGGRSKGNKDGSQVDTGSKGNMASSVDDDLSQFQRVNAEGNAAWAKMEEGAVFRGILLGRFTMKKRDKLGRQRAFYQIKLTRPSFGVKKKKGKPEPLAAGECVNIDEKTAMEELRATASDSANKWEVIVTAVQKMELDGGHTFWKLDIRRRMLADDFQMPDPVGSVGSDDANPDDVPDAEDLA